MRVKMELSLIFWYHLWSRRSVQISFVFATENFLKIKNKWTTTLYKNVIIIIYILKL